MHKFIEAYSGWCEVHENQSGVEFVNDLIDWLKTVDIHSVDVGYCYGCEITFNEYGCLTPAIAFDTKRVKVSVFPWSDMISASFIKLEGDEARNLVYVLNEKVKRHLGLV